MQTNTELIEYLSTDGVLKTPRITDAFAAVDRADFVQPIDAEHAYADRPLPIGGGQTISQPYTVAFMLELLAVREGDTVLDIGSGSGWTTALLAHIAGDRGHVIGYEKQPSLAAFGAENLAAYPSLSAEIREATDTLGAPDDAPFNRILVSAEGGAVPDELLEQLAVGGTLVMPVMGAIQRMTKTAEDEYTSETYPGFVFVPLVH